MKKKKVVGRKEASFAGELSTCMLHFFVKSIEIVDIAFYYYYYYGADGIHITKLIL